MQQLLAHGGEPGDKAIHSCVYVYSSVASHFCLCTCENWVHAYIVIAYCSRAYSRREKGLMCTLKESVAEVRTYMM